MDTEAFQVWRGCGEEVVNWSKVHVKWDSVERQLGHRLKSLECQS